jgi:hypothetical protein
MNWLWTKLFWGLLVLPFLVIVLVRGDTNSTVLNLRVGLFLALWLLAVAVMMRRVRIWPFSSRKDSKE